MPVGTVARTLPESGSTMASEFSSLLPTMRVRAGVSAAASSPAKNNVDAKRILIACYSTADCGQPALRSVADCEMPGGRIVQVARRLEVGRGSLCRLYGPGGQPALSVFFFAVFAGARRFTAGALRFALAAGESPLPFACAIMVCSASAGTP